MVLRFNTLNAWIPRVEHGFAFSPALTALHDNYLNHSSDVNLSLLLQGIDIYQNLPDDKFFSDGRGRNFIRAQYLSMQLGSHFMRMDVLRHAPAAIKAAEYTPAKMKPLDKLALNPFPFFNGPWDFAAHFRDNDLASNMVVEQQPFPIETVSRFL
ncbi:hypothetical protein [Methylocucumis oryzae]|uniref:Uncharacterized protein n=1 Tax=Methylocucumis oryzae TaxID=1632867 RepID=A0A0F3IIA9_9GAMM|nr:hypothetical protein [Methylocucumis oryzae]KJV06402.1 hypothetical protein VZ94_11305 [Methylocucumis oryzae]